MTDKDRELMLKEAEINSMPGDIIPMSFKLCPEAFNDPTWLYEIKWDGYRIVSYSKGKTVELRSRNNVSFTKQFSIITEELSRLNLSAVLDGEVVVLDENGCSDFNSLVDGNYSCLVYYVFDILWYDGRDVTGLPLYQRKELLETILPTSEIIRLSRHVLEKGTELFELCRERKVEGIVAKNMYSHYYPGIRTSNWLKIKCSRIAEGIVAGILLDNDKPGSGFSSLIIGLPENNSYKYVGTVEAGLSRPALQRILTHCKARRESIFQPVPKVNGRSPFRKKIKNAEIIWVEPSISCHVSYLDLDSFGLMRHASFKGLKDCGVNEPFK